MNRQVVGNLAERIKADARACQWRLDHISDYEKSRPWMESAADLVIDTTTLPVIDVAGRIAAEAVTVARYGQVQYSRAVGSGGGLD